MFKNFLSKNKHLRSKKLLPILIIIFAFSLIFLPGYYSLLGLFFAYCGFKLYNKAHLKGFETNANPFTYRSEKRIRQLKFIFILPIVLVFILILVSKPTLIYKVIALLFTIPFFLIYSMIDRYNMVSTTGDILKTTPFFEEKLKKSKKMMLIGLVICFIPWIYLLGMILLILGMVRYFTIKILYSNKNKFSYVYPAHVNVYHKFDNERQTKLN